MTVYSGPDSPYPDRQAMEIVKPFGRFHPGQVYWPTAGEREIYERRGWIRPYVDREVKAAPVDRMLRARAAKAAKRALKTGG